ncbi:hypothetical protein G7070_11110 [Propioniciclava coleopterorum]|uniref:Uncharacterized protein n=1 Tax=Propioniciclava coleopterorum TaxID=2714937 RepID=A0A6G7Y7D0_9ACTN|nr:hypothetical protein [Propioniciclava coleopterorum]QIK72722.1 hypothetical protein G7070_11110 [Propioniciclava coleopterorum]
MRASGVDPRDTTWEQDAVYRVYFEDEEGATDEWRLTAAQDVGEVLDWARARSGSRTFTLYVEADRASDRAAGTERGLIRLL